MATVADNQQTWVPYETTRDCSQGFCSIYCPQWCYVIFPPPPPLGGTGFPDDDSSSGSGLSPLVIAVIGVLAGASLLVGYYTIVSKYCGGLDSLRRRLGRGSSSGGGDDDDAATHGGSSFRHDAWHASASDGLDESVIKSIAVRKYRRADGLIEGTDCSVCLNEFREDESLRLLPKCNHAFHIPCIDTWLKSHPNCPLCRAGIVPATASPSPSPPPQLPSAPPDPVSSPPVPEIRQDGGLAAAGDTERGREEEEADRTVLGAAVAKNYSWTVSNMEEGILPIGRSVSMDASRWGNHMSIADVLGEEDDDSPGEEDYESAVGIGSSGRWFDGEEQGKDGRKNGSLHSVMNPVPMKRSPSSGRFGFARQGRGNNAILPI